MAWDLFISHASEDKDDVARPLADKFIEHGLKVWYDEYTLTVGDSLRRSIDRGLAACRYGLVILSPHFIQKEWTQKELDGLVAREDGSEKRILPVWHNVGRSDVVAFSPTMADKLGVSTSKGLDHVVKEIMRVFHIGDDQTSTPATKPKGKLRSQKRQKTVQPNAPRKGRTTGMWVMIDRFFFVARKVQQGHDGSFIVEIESASAENDADLESLRPQKYGGSGPIPFAARNDAHLVRVKACEKDLSGKLAVWTLTLAPEDSSFGGSGVEATIHEDSKIYTPDNIARLRAGRLLINDPPPKSSDHRTYTYSMVEGSIAGSGKFPIRDCVIRSMYARYGKQSSWRELARLQAIFLLKASGTVDHVLDLTIGPVRTSGVAVKFRGRRRPPYTGHEPVLIEVSGTCSLG